MYIFSLLFGGSILSGNVIYMNGLFMVCLGVVKVGVYVVYVGGNIGLEFFIVVLYSLWLIIVGVIIMDCFYFVYLYIFDG